MDSASRFSALLTEKTNPDTVKIDSVSTLEMLGMINREDQKVSLAVERELPQIARGVDLIVEAFQQGGRLVYQGAGTSGRLGILDASECVPTFGVDKEQVIGLIAGGRTAIDNAVEGAEDNVDAGAADLEAIGFSRRDILVGIAASGRTPYVIGGMKYAAEQGAKVIAVSCVENAEISRYAHQAIEVVAGPEALTGSTRLKAGTAQKMVLNMLSTGSMIRIGKVYGNLMIDVVSTNEKLTERAIRIIMEVSGCHREAAVQALDEADNRVKTAVYMLKTGADAQTADARLEESGGRLRAALEAYEEGQR